MGEEVNRLLDLTQCMVQHQRGKGWFRCAKEPAFIITTEDSKGFYDITICPDCWGEARKDPLLVVHQTRLIEKGK